MSEQKWFLPLLVIAVGTVFLSSMVEGQPGKQSLGANRLRPTSQGFWANQRASRSLNHARDYSQGFYQYSRDAQVIEPPVARSESLGLQNNLNSARHELATVRKESAGQPEVLKSVSSIEDHLNKAEGQHKMLHEACQKDKVDGHTVMSCCNAITKEVDKAIAEHEALMRHLEIQAQSDAATENHHPKEK